MKKIVVDRCTLSLFIEKILLAVDESGHQSEFCWVIGYIMVVNRGNCRELNDVHEFCSLRKQPSFLAPGPNGVSCEGCLRFTTENSIPGLLMGCVGVEPHNSVKPAQ